MVEKISAVTLRVANMRASVRFYKDVLGLEIVYGSEGSYFTSLRTKDGDTILNLEHGNASIRWGRLIFHVSDVDRFWAYLMEKGFHPDSPQDASWGERYFHLPDPDGHELSFCSSDLAVLYALRTEAHFNDLDRDERWAFDCGSPCGAHWSLNRGKARNVVDASLRD